MATKKSQVLSDRFLVGEELGRGAYGQVYKGIDYKTGDTVAIKQISLAGIPTDNLQSVMGEIELLKTLNHKNIVKYIGSFKTRTHLYIILEYMENGSLASIIKPNKFGTFPESLVAVYIAQVLQGLQYLHDQGVVHRDIKGANILTTKDGLVKLADFGVAAKLGEVADPLAGGAGGAAATGRDGGGRSSNMHTTNVVGTPYWMAPEVIEMQQVTSSSDIWSVGCLIVELLTGSPPYYDLITMAAMFRIVQDERPPLPENISPLLEDFLSKCFLKDAKQRPDARTLLQHEWLQHNRRTLRSSWRRDQGQHFRTLLSQSRGGSAAAAAAVGTLAATGGGRQAAEAHESITSVVARIMAAADDDDASARLGGAAAGGAGGTDPAAAAAAGGADGPGGLRSGSFRGGVGSRSAGGAGPAAAAVDEATTSLLANAAAMPTSSSGGEAEPGPAAANAASTLPYAAAANPLPAAAVAEPQLPTSGSTQAAVAAALSAGPPAAAAAAASPLGGLVQRLQLGDAAAAVLQHAAQQQQQHLPAPAMLQPQLSFYDTGHGGALLFDGGAASAYGLLEHSDSLVLAAPGSALGSTLTQQSIELRKTVRELVRSLRPGTRDATAASSARAAASLEQLITPPPSHNSTSPSHTQSGQLQQQAPGTPFSGAASGGPLAAGAAAGVGAAAAIGGGAGGGGAAAVSAVAAAEAKSLFLAEGGVLVLMELLDTDNQKAVEAALDLLSALVRDDVRLLESLCLVGLVPAVARFSQAPWPAGLRLRAAAFVHALCFRRDATLQLFVAAGGLKQLCSMVADSVASEPSALSHVAIQCLLQVLQCYSTLPLNYICRILAQCGLVPRLVKLLREVFAKRKTMTPPPASIATTASTAAMQSPPRQQQQQQQATSPGSPPPPPRSQQHSADHGTPTNREANGLSTRQSREGSGAAALSPLPPLPQHPPAGGHLAGQAMTYTPGGGGGLGQAAAMVGVRAMTLPAMVGGGGSAAAAAAANIPGSSLTYEEVSYLLDKTVYLLLVLSNADGAVKAAVCGPQDNLLGCISCLRELQPPHLVELLRFLRNLTTDPAVLPAIKDAGAIEKLIPLLTYKCPPATLSAAPDPTNRSVVLPRSEVQMETLAALYNLCMFNKTVHLETAAAAGIVPHLCAFAAQGCAAAAAARASPTPPSLGPATTTSTSSPTSPPHPDPSALNPGSPAALAAAAAQWPAVRGAVVPLLRGLVGCSAASRAKLYACGGLDIFLHLLSDQDSSCVLGVLQTLDGWLAEEHSRVEARLVQRDAVGHVVQLYARSCAAQDMQSLLEVLRTSLGRSSKLAVALGMGGLVPCLLAMIPHAAPINRVKILDIVRILYEHYPRPKEFIVRYGIQEVLAGLLRTHGSDADAVIQQAQRLLSAFNINVLL